MARKVLAGHHGGGMGPTSGGAGTGAAAPQGTLGGLRGMVGTRPGARQLRIGDEGYLWILVALEVAAIAWLRSAFRRHHGG